MPVIISYYAQNLEVCQLETHSGHSVKLVLQRDKLVLRALCTLVHFKNPNGNLPCCSGCV